MMRELKLIIKGKVQGVGFRYYAYRLAKALNLKGWVANRRDGSVEIVAQGREADLDKLYKQIKLDSNSNLITARVEQIGINWQQPQTKFIAFNILEDLF